MMKTKSINLFKFLQFASVVLISIISTLSVEAAGIQATTLQDPNPEDTTTFIRVPTDVASLQTAIQQVSDGGVIEMASGTYYSPTTGFSLSNLNKGFTIQAAPGASVVLHGQGTNRILSSYNTSPDQAGHILIKGITIANGYAYQDGVGVVTLYATNATFIDVTFRDNYKASSPGHTVGAAVNIADRSTIYFTNCEWNSNTSRDGGAGLGIRDSQVIIHNSNFVNNRTIAQEYSNMPGGGALNVANSSLRVTNTRFENNQAAGHGGAIWSQGTWGYPTRTSVIIANSAFINNQTVRSIPSPSPMEGGAIVAEDQLDLEIYNSRFIADSAKIGGAMSIFRAQARIYDSVFLGNRATDTLSTSGFGGAINFNYYDRPNDASLTVEDTYFQGRYGSTTTVAQFSGGIHVHGIASATRPPVTLRRVILNDLDVTVTASSRAGTGGALGIQGANFLMEDSFVMNSDALGPYGGIGGGITIYAGTLATIRRSVIAYNKADTYGGGLMAQGAQILVDDSLFFGNEVSPGTSEPDYQSYGAAAFTTPETSINAPVSGTIRNSTFVQNTGMAIFDDDRSGGPINAVVYNNNRFYETTFGDKVYKNSLTLPYNPAGLNSLVVSHTGGLPSVDKSTIANAALSSTPVLTKLSAAPPALLPNAAPGEATQNPPAYLGYVWNGASATLDGIPLGSKAGVMATTTSGTHTLSVGGSSATAQVTNAPTPLFSLSVTPGTPPVLHWSLTSGTFLDMAIDNGLTFTPAPSGSVALTSNNDVYHFFGVTKQGGYYSTVYEYSLDFHVFLPITTR
jgi:predicted outer membrane repeat protein